MLELKTTTTSDLLTGLCDPNNDLVWQAFDRRFRPILTGVSRRLGLSEADAAEVAQAALVDFAQAYREGRYDRERGRLSSWLIRMARNRAMDMHRGRARRREFRGESAMVDLPEEQAWQQTWDAEQRQTVFEQAWRLLSNASKTTANTLRAFERFALRQEPAEKVAGDCGVTVAEVYRIKSRLTQKLRGIVEDLTQQYAE